MISLLLRRARTLRALRDHNADARRFNGPLDANLRHRYAQNKCRTKTCPARAFRLAAKRACVPTLRHLGEESAEVCDNLCGATMIKLQSEQQNSSFFQTEDDDREVNGTPLSTKRTAAFDSQFRANDTAFERLQRCLGDCRAKRAERNPLYKKCVDDRYLSALSECMAASCSEQALKCVQTTCKIELGGDGERNN